MPAKKQQKTALSEGHTALGTPLYVSLTPEGYQFTKASTKTRRNAASTIERTDRFANIDSGLVPFKYGSGKNTSSLNPKDAIILCQKAYYNFAIFRNTIDLMAEFSASKIYFEGGSKKVRDFFEAFFKKINLWSFQDKFFREFFRSGNVFIYRFDALIQKNDLKKITQTFGAEANDNKIPIRYVILNPSDIEMQGSASFAMGTYYKVLSDYELEILRKPRTEQDKELFDSLDPEVKQKITSKGVGEVQLPLNNDKVYAVFYKKQDYEPFAAPMGYPVLEDINWKAELKKMDMAIARTMQQAILLITMGAKPEDGGVNQKNMEAMQALFENESVGRVLIADYTTKAAFVIPEIADILDPKKYEVVDKDIQIGLNNILIGNEKFANQSIKVNVFVERLKQAREAFLNEFLIPEIKRIAQSLGFKNYPTPHFIDIDLKDGLEFARIYTRLIEIGALTPEEGIEAVNTGRLPTPEESLESQRKYIEYKKEGLYQPIVGGQEDKLELAEKTGEIQLQVQQQKISQQNGRPPGTKRKQSTKKMTPIGGSYSLNKIKENMLLAQDLEDKITKALKKKFKLKELNAQQIEVRDNLALIIMGNESPDNWNDKIASYVENPVDTKPENIDEIHNIACEHQVDSYLATLLYRSKND